MKQDQKTARCFYPAVFRYQPDKVVVTFPDFDITTSGSDEPSAFLAARVVLGRRLYQLEQGKHEFPSPTLLKDVELEEEESITLIDVYMPSVRTAESNRSVNRMISLPAWLNAAAMERNINFSQTLQEALKQEIFNDYTSKTRQTH